MQEFYKSITWSVQAVINEILSICCSKHFLWLYCFCVGFFDLLDTKMFANFCVTHHNLVTTGNTVLLLTCLNVQLICFPSPLNVWCHHYLFWPLVHVDIEKYWFHTVPVQVVESKTQAYDKFGLIVLILTLKKFFQYCGTTLLASTSEKNMNNISRLLLTTWCLFSSMPKGDSNPRYIKNWVFVKLTLQSFYSYLNWLRFL